MEEITEKTIEVTVHKHRGTDQPRISYNDLLDKPTGTSGTTLSRAYRNTTNQAISDDSWTKVQLNAESFDIGGEFDSTTNYRFTATTTGYYLVCGQIKITNSAS